LTTSGDDPPLSQLGARITDTPVPAGSSFPVVPIIVDSVDAGAVPDGVTNWDLLQGALLAVLVKRPGSELTVIEGTAVMIAPGLALTASHVFSDLLPDLASGKASLGCIGIRTSGLDIWTVRKVSSSETNDLAYLSLEPLSALTDGWHFSCLQLTTRTPAVGEELNIVGFRFLDVKERGKDYLAEGDLYAAGGEVTATYYPARDAVRMPFPAIEIACDSLGGMSGGAVLDSESFLVGIISSGYAASEGQIGTTYAAWVIGGLNRELEIPWPPGIYSDPTHVLDMPKALLRIVGRDAITIIDGRTIQYRPWIRHEDSA
jgi:V8-like Glu-specific endopeptidase